ncbi:hypothetical protein QR680_009792 [Steinernema hermaphroditum]|uniref:Major facilitator superfamily (MFS) profile domain-containing protein n=1 Tax=Steinernema hermaphroditum TaxID=289476 RepID=A0AA39ILN7_9BILA|nr:hypothetical protein QR680_009792 [Steinernema hermaphroditum]
MRYISGRGVHWEKLDQVGIVGAEERRSAAGLCRFAIRAKEYLGRKVAPEVYRHDWPSLIEAKMGLPVKLLFLSLGLYFAGSFQQAYLLSILNQPYLEVQQFINESIIARTGEPVEKTFLDFLWSGINVINPVSGIVGQLLSYAVCDRFGRKHTAILSCIIAIPGLLLSLFSKLTFPYFEFLVAGRFLWGLSNGVATVVQTVWLIESAPVQYRGNIGTWQEGIATVGNLLTQAVGVALATSTLWPFIFVVPFGVNLVCMCIFIVMPESPQWLLMHRDDRAEAERALKAYHGLRTPLEIEIQLEKCRSDGQNKTAKLDEKRPSGFKLMFCPWLASDDVSVVVRYGAWVGIMVKIAYVFTGARVIRSFNTYIYHQMGGLSLGVAQWGSLGNTIVRLPLAVIPIFLVERVGRRPLMLITQLLSVFALSSVMICIQVGPAAKYGTLVSISALLFSTSIGIGCISRFYSAELVPKSLLLGTVTILSILESMLKIALDFGFYPLANAVGAWSMLIFILPSIALLVLMWQSCPETKGRSVNAVLNDMALRLNRKVSFKV